MTDFLSFIAGAILWAAQAAAAVPLEPQDPDRPRAEIRDFKGLRENNIFSPFRAKRTEPPRGEPRPPGPVPPAPPPPAKPKPPVVTGFVFDEKIQAFQVLVEDRNSDVKLKLFAQPRFLKAGEEFLGYAVESVGMEAVSVKVGEKVSELRVGDSFPEKAPEVPEKKEAPSAPTGDKPAEAAPPGEKAETAPAGEKPAEAAPPAGKAEAPPAAAEKTEAAPAPGDAERNKVLEELKKKFKKKRDEADFEQP